MEVEKERGGEGEGGGRQRRSEEERGEKGDGGGGKEGGEGVRIIGYLRRRKGGRGEGC